MGKRFRKTLVEMPSLELIIIVYSAIFIYTRHYEF